MSAWRLETERRDAVLSDHLCELLDHVEPVRDQLELLTLRGYRIDWWSSVESLHTERAIELGPALLGRLSAFPGPLLIDAWSVESDDE